MLNYAVPSGLLASRVPSGTELELFQGRCLVSVVGFMFEHTRVRGLPVPFHRSFEEVNLRFYVTRREGAELRRGVAFIREIVPRRAVAWIARELYEEPYVALPMRHRDRRLEVGYRLSLGGRWHEMRALLGHEFRLPEPGSEEHFITEHYYGYTAQRDGGTIEYRVEHPPWPVCSVSAATLDFDVSAVYGDEFAPYLTRGTASALLASGSAVTVSSPRRLPS